MTDPAQIIANGLATVDTGALLKYVIDYVTLESVDTVVLGLPTQTNGQPSENQARVIKFADKLRAALPAVKIEFYDERFTSVLAHQAILDSGIGRKRRREDKGLVDEISACIILQSYLESKRL